ncbi:inositol monophosphatase family protein [Convivina intestini]|uniref:Myo-inositol-1(Or 4)-monophosphatase n=1 Tax=Convivina intestini TaxID=1505726 RepID=A0A2U1DFH3_9LACO|nr:inositol monophosphatase family protein [Convivina intestini]PVY86431.1 myo-inositol-1(or 4)-monophosphatase [Convivina intestini]CAH1850332.1 Fructose-1, 6-bisphosphatase/inositol-1-monophosphatase [Convivina intestini]SDB83628.1 myo-inositol-1(or 4)-monophosphatase [Leuconostocaceae bacterium R-53105]
MTDSDLKELKAIDQMVCHWLEELMHQAQGLVQSHLDVQHKDGDTRNLVTNVDRENERWLDQKIRTFNPEAKIISEEGFGDHPLDMEGDVWFVDPIDGTMNFVHEHTDFAIMVALYRDGQPLLGWIADVMGNDIYHGGPAIGVQINQQQLSASPDLQLSQSILMLSGRRLVAGDYGYKTLAQKALAFRVIGSAGITFSYLLKGQVNGYFSKLMPWDVAAGRVLAEGLGFIVTNLDGQALNMLSSNTVLIATDSTHHEIVTMLKG